MFSLSLSIPFSSLLLFRSYFTQTAWLISSLLVYYFMPVMLLFFRLYRDSHLRMLLKELQLSVVLRFLGSQRLILMRVQQYSCLVACRLSSVQSRVMESRFLSLISWELQACRERACQEYFLRSYLSLMFSSRISYSRSQSCYTPSYSYFMRLSSSRSLQFCPYSRNIDSYCFIATLDCSSSQSKACTSCYFLSVCRCTTRNRMAIRIDSSSEGLYSFLRSRQQVGTWTPSSPRKSTICCRQRLIVLKN